MTSLDPLRGFYPLIKGWIEGPNGTDVIPPGKIFPERIKRRSFIPPVKEMKKYGDGPIHKKKEQLFIKKVKSSNLIDQENPAKWNIY